MSREKRGKLGKQKNQVAVDGGGKELQTAVVRNYKRRWRRTANSSGGKGERKSERRGKRQKEDHLIQTRKFRI